MTQPAVTVVATGDVFNDLPDPNVAFRHLAPLLRSADLVFGNCEGIYSDHLSLAPSRNAFHGAPAARAQGLGNVPFHVMSCANNHILDGGYDALAETIGVLRDQGIMVTGAGENLDAAVEPVVIERAGMTIAFLSFCSCFPIGYEARADRPGLAPLRVSTLYRAPAGPWDPGIEPAIVTIPEPGDLTRYRAAIRVAAESADAVIVSCHWGYSGVVRERLVPPSQTHRREWIDGVQDYEVQLAREAIDHGASAVICHHQLSLRGVACYKGAPIFHGLGILVNHFHGDLGGVIPDSEDERFPLLPFEATARQTGVAVLEFGAGGRLRQAGFIPAMILPDGSTEPLRPEDPRAAQVIQHLLDLSDGVDGDPPRADVGVRDGWAYVRISGGNGP
jgi:poly-gamma-glutamate capsule biosynthesis protein CapA/YwtB (metallophosphatase superfamily)